jgi:hypothetical protein
VHFTILDPRTNTGTCTKEECPFCKPKDCCGAHHKHFVINTESREGVCVRHNDDCTPVCMPKGDEEPEKPRVCSKGCNQLAKISKADSSVLFAGTPSESDLFDMVVCQADKWVTCAGRQLAASNTVEAKAHQETRCEVEKEIKAVAFCTFRVDLWNLGGTCIANHLHNTDGAKPNCPKPPGMDKKRHGSVIAQIPSMCIVANLTHHKHCTRIGMSY